MGDVSYSLAYGGRFCVPHKCDACEVERLVDVTTRENEKKRDIKKS